MSDTTYNGWRNYPTWAVNLWLSNDEGLYDATREVVAGGLTYADDHPNVASGIWTQAEANRFAVADALKAWVRDELPVQVDNGQGGSESTEQLLGFHADLLGYALDQVDWQEIADGWLEAVEA